MVNSTLFIAYINGPDLLLNAYKSYLPYFNDIRILNNSLSPLEGDYSGAKVTDMRVSLNTGQSFNWFRSIALEEGMESFFWSHHDCVVTPEQIERTMEFVQTIGDPKWGMVFTHYDVFCAFNTEALREVGGWDTLRFQYYSGDCDLYRRIKKAGWKKYEIGGEGVTHFPSSTIRRCEERMQIVNRIALLEVEFYKEKWGFQDKKD